MTAPTFSSFTPDNILEGSASFRIDCYGAGFTANTTLHWNFSDTGISGVTVVDATHLYGTVDASLVVTNGSQVLSINDPEDGQSALKLFSVDTTNSIPNVYSVEPLEVPKNTGPWTVKITGTNFECGQTSVYADGSPITTLWETADIPSGTVIYGVIPNEVNPTTISINVQTPAPGGGNTAGFSFEVVEPRAVPILMAQYRQRWA